MSISRGPAETAGPRLKDPLVEPCVGSMLLADSG